MAELKLVVVTPEKTELTVDASSVVVPMDDGQLGILPGRAPMIGRLGYGPMRVKSAEGETTYFIDGGFLQITPEAVNVLTDALKTMNSLVADEAKSDLETALQMPSNSVEQMQLKDKAVRRARAKVQATS